MLFPEHKRNIYRKSTLQGVSIEFRYSPLLIIDTEAPAKFQEKIIEHFPQMEEKIQNNHGVHLQIDVLKPDSPATSQSTLSTMKLWTFRTPDGNTTVTLSKNSLAVTTQNYDRWESFRTSVNIALSALLECYSATSFTRLGLRYVNVFSRKKLGISTRKHWKNLINPVFLGLLATPYHDKVIGYQSIHDIDFKEENARARIISSQAQSSDDMKNYSIMLDSDFYIAGALSKGSIWEKADYLHEQSRSLLEYVVKNDLRAIMEVIE